jgi:hypothetical protein
VLHQVDVLFDLYYDARKNKIKKKITCPVLTYIAAKIPVFLIVNRTYSKKAGLEINSSKTEEICVNTIVKQMLRLNGEDIERLSDFCYLCSILAENGGTSRESHYEKTLRLGYLMPV